MQNGKRGWGWGEVCSEPRRGIAIQSAACTGDKRVVGGMRGQVEQRMGMGVASEGEHREARETAAGEEDNRREGERETSVRSEQARVRVRVRVPSCPAPERAAPSAGAGRPGGG